MTMTEKILVVDDEEPVREVVCSLLRNAGYQCRPAVSGLEALEILATGDAFDLVLTDLMMSGLDGIGLLGFNSVVDYDYPVVMGVLLLSSILLLVGNILSDMLVAAVDPRIRFK